VVRFRRNTSAAVFLLPRGLLQGLLQNAAFDAGERSIIIEAVIR
jgi:hypothetical protein